MTKRLASINIHKAGNGGQLLDQIGRGLIKDVEIRSTNDQIERRLTKSPSLNHIEVLHAQAEIRIFFQPPTHLLHDFDLGAASRSKRTQRDINGSVSHITDVLTTYADGGKQINDFG